MAASPFARLLQTLEARDTITALERARIEALPYRLKDFQRNEEIVAEGAKPSHSCLLVEGVVARANIMRDGSRQLSAVHLPGDFIDLHGFVLKIMDHGVTALTSCTVAFVAHPHVRDLMDSEPHLGRMLWMLTAIDAAIERAWISSMGRKSAARHLANLICEVYMRLKVVGLANGGVFDFAITQTDLSDMLGISPVHANRVLQELRQGGMLAWNGKRVEIFDFGALADFGEFNALSLNLINEPR